MKTCFQASILALACLVLIWPATAGATPPPVALAVTPNVTSNTYPGVITLNISGLTSSETVILQKWLDGNGNGLVDAGDVLIDGGKITDGEVMIIGGVTNISKPFDSNPAGGAVTVTLNFAPVILENIVAKEIYRIISPTARFTPVTALFTATNAATAQRVTGIIYSNGVTPLAYASVVAVPANGGYAGAAVADAAGQYSLNLNPGTFFLIPIAPNYYCDQSLAPVVILTNGVSATNNLSLNVGTTIISGNVYNPSNSNPHEGLMLELQSGSLFTLAFTDTNGNYSAAVTPDFWKIKPTKERMARRALVASNSALQVDATAGNVTNANIALPKGNALFYGRITDNAGVPFANIRFEGGDGGTNNLFSAIGYGDTNGYYAVAVLGGISSDWNANAASSDNTVLANYVLNNCPNTNIALGQAILQNFVALPVTAHISGRVLDNLGNPVESISLYADQFIGGNNYTSQNVDTDGSGNYSLGVANGAWDVRFSNGNDDLSSHGLVDLYGPYHVTVPPTNIVLNITVYQDGTPLMNQPARVSPGQFSFNINGSIGVSYTVQVSTNLASTNWANLYTFQLTSNAFPIVDPQATNGARYYRVKKN
jgi:hypothetical protein